MYTVVNGEGVKEGEKGKGNMMSTERVDKYGGVMFWRRV